VEVLGGSGGHEEGVEAGRRKMTMREGVGRVLRGRSAVGSRAKRPGSSSMGLVPRQPPWLVRVLECENIVQFTRRQHPAFATCSGVLPSNWHATKLLTFWGLKKCLIFIFFNKIKVRF
jgi:hypothetical protein